MSSEELKREIFLLCGAVDRGFSASAAQRQQVLDTVVALEASAECESPLDDARLLGDWALVYTNALDIVSLALFRPVATVSGVYQNVRARDNTKFDVINVVELEPPIAPVANLFMGRTCSRLEVAAVGSRRADDPRKLDIAFERGRIRQESFGGYEIPVTVPSISWPFGASPVGYIETTYLDDELRIARSPPMPGISENAEYLHTATAEWNYSEPNVLLNICRGASYYIMGCSGSMESVSTNTRRATLVRVAKIDLGLLKRMKRHLFVFTVVFMAILELPEKARTLSRRRAQRPMAERTARDDQLPLPGGGAPSGGPPGLFRRNCS
eukprot:IDg16094t1